MIVAATNVVSELMRDDPAPLVVNWARGIDATDLTITVVTVTEIEYGLARLPDGRRKRDLTARWHRVLSGYSDRLLDYDLEAAQAAADMLAERDRVGRSVSLADAQIAGICRAQGLRLATRNTKDFDSLGLDLINPFDDASQA
ncbi:MAG: type II toxin-antitoxin system VapC family toxin [Micrococcales bacterium]|nr:type II toxin-antitoxin system VapC family toxin [Micrococcales bacterium]